MSIADRLCDAELAIDTVLSDDSQALTAIERVTIETIRDQIHRLRARLDGCISSSELADCIDRAMWCARHERKQPVYLIWRERRLVHAASPEEDWAFCWLPDGTLRSSEVGVRLSPDYTRG